MFETVFNEVFTMIESYEKKWIVIDESNYKKVNLEVIEKALLINPINSFPQRNFLTEQEVILLSELESKQNWTGEDFSKLLKLRYKRGISENNFQTSKEDLRQLIIKSKNKDLILPKWFKILFSDYEIFTRFRFGDISFSIVEGIIPFPNDENYHLIPFLGNSQGFCWWSILIDKKSNYCIVYRDLHWRENPSDSEPTEYGEYFICSGTFEEFLIRLSKDRIEKEKKTTFLTKNQINNTKIPRQNRCRSKISSQTYRLSKKNLSYLLLKFL